MNRILPASLIVLDGNGQKVLILQQPRDAAESKQRTSDQIGAGEEQSYFHLALVQRR